MIKKIILIIPENCKAIQLAIPEEIAKQIKPTALKEIPEYKDPYILFDFEKSE